MRFNSSKTYRVPYLQKGLVLFFALMALFVMSIAAVALIGSVDTNSIVSGNLAYRQSAITSSNVAAERVAQELSAITSTSGNLHDISRAYFANCSHFDTTPSKNLCDGNTLTSMTWDNTNSRLVPTLTDGNSAITDGIDKQGNTIRYVVERMCNYTEAEVTAGTAAADSSRCRVANPGGDDGCSRNGGNLEYILKCKAKANNPLYRVTLRIAGPKNSVSFLQTFYSN